MSTYDPRIVAQALDDLQDQLTRWSSVASDMLAAATDTQRHAKEAVERAMHNAAIVLDRTKDDEESVQKAVSSVAAAIEKCTTAKTTAHETLKEARRVLEAANATLQKWQAELEKALAWLARAEARLAKAIQEHYRAQSILADAMQKLRNARGFIAEAAALATVRKAEQLLIAAKHEVTAAKAEVEKAKVRVACCKQAVAFSTQAVSLAQEGESSGTQAVNLAERSLEFAQAAERVVRVAQEKLAAEVEAAESMMTETYAAQSFTDAAALYLRNADGAEDSAQIYSTSVRRELEHRAQLLYELNRPSLDSGWQAVSSSTEGTHGYPYQKARKDFMLASLSDPNVAKHIKGWIQQEVNRVGNSGYWRSPPGYDVGHKTAGIDQPDNFQWENSGMNRSKGAKFKR